MELGGEREWTSVCLYPKIKRGCPGKLGRGDDVGSEHPPSASPLRLSFCNQRFLIKHLPRIIHTTTI